MDYMADQPHQPLQGDYQTMHSPLSGIVRRAPVTVPPQISVRAALQIMEREGIGSVVIAESETRIPLGIFTLHDLLRRISVHGGDLEQPIANVMTRGLVTLEPEATAHQAVLTMARQGLRHILIVDEQERLLGIVSQNDLFSLQRVGIKEISNDIAGAQNIDSLIHAARDIHRFTDSMLAQGVGAEQLTYFISTLNDLLTLRIIELTQSEFRLPSLKWCWIALGSEGRFEQTFTTDQDNAIVFESTEDDAERIRQQLVPFAQAVNRKLDACGFLLCKGKIMAGNPMWCMSLNEWQRKFSAWIQTPEPEALLFASIFFDFRPLYGAHELTAILRNWLLDACSKNSLFLYQMAENALRTQPPLGIFRDFRVQRTGQFPHTIDLKMTGLWPFIGAARVFALAYGMPETNTARRLRSVAGKIGFSSDETAAIVDSFYYIQRLRLRHQHNLQGLAAGANRINPDALNPLERSILKEAFTQARRLQRRLRLEYQL
jgi:CBS domain-containing protein